MTESVVKNTYILLRNDKSKKKRRKKKKEYMSILQYIATVMTMFCWMLAPSDTETWK